MPADGALRLLIGGMAAAAAAVTGSARRLRWKGAGGNAAIVALLILIVLAAARNVVVLSSLLVSDVDGIHVKAGVDDKPRLRLQQLASTLHRVALDSVISSSSQNNKLLVLSYSLAGNNPKQYEIDGCIKAATEAPALYPGWQVRIHHSPNLQIDIVHRLQAIGSHVKLVDVTDLLSKQIMPQASDQGRIDPCFWNFLVASDPNVEAYVVRDVRYALSRRESSAVQEWMESGRKFHIIRDHPSHHPSVMAIVSGLWGARESAIPNIVRLLEEFGDANSENSLKDADQLVQSFLWEKILPLVKGDCFQHDSYYCEESGGVAFPTTRSEVGAPLDFAGGLHNDMGKVGNERTPPNISDSQKCLILEKNRSRYMKCLRRRQDEQFLGNMEAMVDEQKRISSTHYSGPMIANPTDDVDICTPNHDDEFYDLKKTSVSLKEMKKIGRLSGRSLGLKASATAKLTRGGGAIEIQGGTANSGQDASPSFTFWSSDFHIAPIADVKDLFQSWARAKDYHIIDESGSGHCELKDTCATNLRVINRNNGLGLGPCPNELKREFHREYAQDERMNYVDAFFCHHATGLCEMFMSFSRPLIAVVSTRYEIGRVDAWAWKRLNANLVAIASNARNTIAANNRYDAEYVKHFTGLKDVPVIPNFCNYITDRWNPTRPEILVGPGRISVPGKYMIRDELKVAAAVAAGKLMGVGGGKKLNIKRAGINQAEQRNAKSPHVTWPLEFVSIREKYGRFEYSDLASHPAIVLIPYQVSIMSVFEYYRMGIPCFAPSVKLLARWQFEKRVMHELTWSCVSKECEKASSIQGHFDSPHGDRDPNDMSSIENIEYWIKYADFYELPEITLYDSWEDLFEKIMNADLDSIHQRMMIHNNEQKNKIRAEWTKILNRAFDGTTPRWQSIQSAKTSAGDRPIPNQMQAPWEEAVLMTYPTVARHTNITC